MPQKHSKHAQRFMGSFRAPSETLGYAVVYMRLLDTGTPIILQFFFFANVLGDSNPVLTFFFLHVIKLPFFFSQDYLVATKLEELTLQLSRL